MSKNEHFWTLGDYRRWLGHPEVLVRQWAAHRIEEQYPQEAAESFVGLLDDTSTHLRFLAARTLGQSGDPRYEPALLAALPQSEGSVRGWTVFALAQLGSRALLPQLVADVEAAAQRAPTAPQPEELWLMLDALGYYPDPEARAALWQFVERYPEDDRLSQAAFSALLRFPEPDTIPRLVERYREFRGDEQLSWIHAGLAFADAADLQRMTQEAITAVREGPEAALETIERWLDTDVPISAPLDAAIAVSPGDPIEAAATLLPLLSIEIMEVAAARGDDLLGWQAAWAAGDPPNGYRWRTLVAHLVVAALAAHPPPDEARARVALGLGLALTAQVVTDENDEAALQVAVDEAARREVLLDILSSPRQNVLPDVVEQVAALGPAVVPDLNGVLEDGPFWALPRTLETLAKIARTHPGAADAVVPAVLDLIYEDQSDYVLEPAGEALVVIGPAAVEPAAERLGQGDMSYDIYVTGALGEIPSEASVEALLDYVADVGLDDWSAEILAELGHPRVIPVLQEAYRPGDQLLAQFLYVLGVLNGSTDPAMDRWRAEALAAHERFERALAGELPPLPPAPSLRTEAEPAPSLRTEAEPAPSPTPKRATSADKQRKKRRSQEKAARKAQRKQKKKKKRR